jgi:hypothetical protein
MSSFRRFTLNEPESSTSWPLTTETGIGTDCRSSSTRRAVTMISSSLRAPSWASAHPRRGPKQSGGGGRQRQRCFRHFKHPSMPPSGVGKKV